MNYQETKGRRAVVRNLTGIEEAYSSGKRDTVTSEMRDMEGKEVFVYDMGYDGDWWRCSDWNWHRSWLSFCDNTQTLITDDEAFIGDDQ